MKNRILLIFATMIFLAFVSNVSADVNLWRNVIQFNNESVIRNHAYYQFYDTGSNLQGKVFPIPVVINYNWQDIPYNISQFYPQYPNAYVDWCNFTALHTYNDYDDLGNLIESNETIYTYNITSSFAGNNQLNIFMKHQDSLVIDFDCHYTNPDTLYIDSVLFGDFDTHFPAFSCSGCGDTKLEELAKEIQYNEEKVVDEVKIYQRIQSAIGLNYRLWVFFSWFVKVGLIFLAIGLIFFVGYVFYQIINGLATGGRR